MRLFTPFALSIALLAGAPAAYADEDADRARDALRAGRVMPLAQIVQQVQGQVPGEILETELDLGDDDASEYEIRMLTREGRIVELEVDARTGRILDIDEDD